VENTGKLSHLDALRGDVRDEIKRRIQQRDQYSMQLTVALGAIAVGAFSTNGTHRLFLVAPLVAIYFTALILYSYRIHDLLARYLRDELEPELASESGISPAKEWETWYVKSGHRPGVRRWFFVLEMWLVTALSLSFVWYKESRFSCALLLVTIAYFIIAALTSTLLRKEKKN
jgi:hypothetical protein